MAGVQAESGDLLAFEGRVCRRINETRNLWKSAGGKSQCSPLPGERNRFQQTAPSIPTRESMTSGSGAVPDTPTSREGANHIAVMHTQPDGTTIMVQVAPPPAADEP